MASNSPETPQKPPSATRFIKAMGPGLHKRFDATAKREVPSEFLHALKQADRRHLLDPKDD